MWLPLGQITVLWGQGCQNREGCWARGQPTPPKHKRGTDTQQEQRNHVNDHKPQPRAARGPRSGSPPPTAAPPTDIRQPRGAEMRPHPTQNCSDTHAWGLNTTFATTGVL